MDDRVNLMGGEHLREQFRIAHVAVHEFAQTTPAQLLHPAQRLGRGVRQVIHHNHVLPCTQQLDAGMRADIARPASDQCHAHDSAP